MSGPSQRLSSRTLCAIASRLTSAQVSGRSWLTSDHPRRSAGGSAECRVPGADGVPSAECPRECRVTTGVLSAHGAPEGAAAAIRKAKRGASLLILDACALLDSSRAIDAACEC